MTPRLKARAAAATIAAALLGGSALLPAQAGPDPLPAIAPITLTPIATGLDGPVVVTQRPGDDTLFVVEQVGRITAIRNGAVDPTPVLDITDTPLAGGLEQGLLGLAFDPSDPDYLYIDYNDAAGDTHLVEYQMAADGLTVDESTRRELLFVEQPFANHNGGNLVFGPDGYLYFGLGDGGSAGDPQGNGQDLTSLLGKMLRIDPRGGSPYGIPGDNPFVGTPDARDEIWAYGLRNPWRWSFDKLTGDLWIGDVGQNLWEEIDFQPADSLGGENYGWNAMEGTHPYEDGVEPDNHTPPIYDYPHGMGCSITGGYVYRGENIPLLQGTYIFSDFCAGRIWTLANILGVNVALETGVTVPTIASFGEDLAGELYAMDLAGNVFRIDSLIPTL